MPGRANGSAGQPRRPTMADVAARAGVSRALVSIVFRDQPGAGEETRRRVKEAAAELGYQVDLRAQLLSRQQSRLIGVSFGVGHEFHADVVTELYAAARARGYELALSGVTRYRSESDAARNLLALRCDALILLGPSSRAIDLARLGSRSPTVVIARPVTAPGIEVVRSDDEAGAAMATRHLIELGHRRIVHVDGGRAPGAAERRRGYRRAMRAAGLTDQTTIVRGGLQDTDGSAAAHAVLEQHQDATAVSVFNDQAAIGFLSTARSLGCRIPEELSVTGYDNTTISRAEWARLTTVGQQAATIACAALDKAIDRIDGGEPTTPVLVEPILIPRYTTAPCPAR